ncbi:MAG: DNA primase [Clostridia bacterium]
MSNKQEWTNFIDELKSKNDIVDVISSYTVTTQKGRAFWALCPFHGEKTSSFAINKEGQYYKCFGCGVSGDVIKFVQDIEGCTFMEAVEILAKRVNMPVPVSQQNDDAVAKKHKLRQTCYDVCLASARHYHDNLVGNQGKLAREYLISRGINSLTTNVFGLGYSLGFDQLPSYLASQNISYIDAVNAGVIAKGRNDTYYDCLYNRLIVPLINISGDVIGFGGRTLGSDKTIAKYKNTQDTLAHEKNKNLFGINLVKKNKPVGRLNSIIVLEGYMDVISLYQCGITNAVASMGTSLTKEQAKLLKRLTDNVYICYDGDSAGQSATIRGLDILKDAGVEVRVISLPNKLDPDEFVRKEGVEQFKLLVDKALPLIDYKLKVLQDIYPINSPNIVKQQEAKRKFLASAISIVKGLDAVDKESYCKLLAEKTQINLDFIKKEVYSLQAVAQTTSDETTKISKESSALCFIAKSLLANKPYATLVEKLSLPLLPELDTIFSYIYQCRQCGKQTKIGNIFDLGIKDRQIIDNIVSEDELTQEEQVKYYNDCLIEVEVYQLVNKLESIMVIYQNTNDITKKQDIMRQIQQLTKQIRIAKQKKGEI